jgi:hypothetical protein
VDITFAVSYMDASSRVIYKFHGLLQVFEPSDALLLLDRNSRWVSLSLERGGPFKFFPGPEFAN